MEWVYDRTQADVERVKVLNDKYAAGTISEEEKMEWAAGMKGALNVADLNRIESNIREIAETLQSLASFLLQALHRSILIIFSASFHLP